MQLAAWSVDRVGNQARRIATEVERNPPVGGPQRAAPHPDHLAHRHELVEEARVVSGDATGDDVALDHARGQRGALQLEDDLEEAVDTARPHADAMPRGKESRQRLGRNGFDFAAQRGQRAPAERAKNFRVAMLATMHRRSELAGDHLASRHQLCERIFDHRAGQIPSSRDVGSDKRHLRARPAAYQRDERFGTRIDDDIGTLPIGQDGAEAFYRVVDAAYEKRSLAVTSNLHPAGFDTIMPKALATPAVDRLLHHAHLINTDVSSRRLAEAAAGRGVKPLS